MITPRLLAWKDGSLDEVAERGHYGDLLVADSFLLSEGAVRALEPHRSRFFAGAASLTTIDDEALGAFWTAAITELPRSGDLFPRLEIVRSSAGDTPALRVRAAPALGVSVRVASLDQPDPRLVPAVKGPDLEKLLGLRRTAALDGIDESVILSPAGHIVDGVTSAVLWWRGDRLMAPSAALPRVDSVTAKSLRLIAAATGTATGEEFAGPADLGGCEVWVVNSLHGIRVVTSWRGAPALGRKPQRAALWQRRLNALVRQLP